MKINELKTKLEKELKDDWFDNVYIEASDLKIKCKDVNKNKIVYNIKFDEENVEYDRRGYIRSDNDVEYNIRDDVKDIADWVKKLPTSKEYSNIISKGECKTNKLYAEYSDIDDDENETDVPLMLDILIDVDVIFTLKQSVVDDAHLLKLIKNKQMNDSITTDAIALLKKMKVNNIHTETKNNLSTLTFTLSPKETPYFFQNNKLVDLTYDYHIRSYAENQMYKLFKDKLPYTSYEIEIKSNHNTLMSEWRNYHEKTPKNEYLNLNALKLYVTLSIIELNKLETINLYENCNENRGDFYIDPYFLFSNVMYTRTSGTTVDITVRYITDYYKLCKFKNVKAITEDYSLRNIFRTDVSDLVLSKKRNIENAIKKAIAVKCKISNFKYLYSTTMDLKNKTSRIYDFSVNFRIICDKNYRFI